MGTYARANLGWLVIVALVAVGGVSGGYRWGSSAGRDLTSLAQAKLKSCEDGQQAVIHAGKQFAVESAELEEELLAERVDHARDTQAYEDSMRIINAMLPDEAERTITNHYRRQRQKSEIRAVRPRY